ncbi:restriction endonuclease [Acidovorax carolinensis]|uniref:Restriction endonuclease n=2 Tax=Acidovorax carolinensis TaxID=553814 RepID=A0A240UI94_9BURK|nr:restriction endonuclease [Acidovorax carolinensis]ART56895.1 restriction endonuclease [Acidovorax carolinensis]ART60740.1 restriction endonuclease [Acidovorax carolinensis]
MAEKSLFAMLLRSPWWVSFVVVGLIVLAAGALLPKEYFVVGALAGFPIFVVGCVAAWKQLRAPHPAKVTEMLGAVATMPWRDFANTLAAAWTHAGYTVERVPGNGAADFCLAKGGSTTLASARRWKAATHGVEPLRELRAAMEQRGAATGLYVLAQGSLSDNARLYARDHGITIVQDDTLAALLLTKP